jgi:xanthine/uracil permease
VIVACSIGMGIIPIASPEFYSNFPTWVETIFESGISAAAVTAVALNILFNVRGRRDEVAPVFAEGPAIGDMSEADVRPAPH